MAANETTLGLVHEMLGRRAIRMLEREERAQEASDGDGDVYELSEAAITNMLKMLKDSNVTMAPAKNNVTGALAEKLADRARQRSPQKAMPSELQDALNNMNPTLKVV